MLPDLPGGGLTDGTVTLRPLGPADAEDMYALQQRPEIVAAQVPAEPHRREHGSSDGAPERRATGWPARGAELAIRDAVDDSSPATSGCSTTNR